MLKLGDGQRKKNAFVTIYQYYLGAWDELIVSIDLILIFYFYVAKENESVSETKYVCF